MIKVYGDKKYIEEVKSKGLCYLYLGGDNLLVCPMDRFANKRFLVCDRIRNGKFSLQLNKVMISMSRIIWCVTLRMLAT